MSKWHSTTMTGNPRRLKRRGSADDKRKPLSISKVKETELTKYTR